MAAQEPPNDLELCPKCFEMVSRSGPACLEADCPMLDRTGQSGSDAAVYPELARANLKRMRGEYDEARSICLSILKRYPGNLTAHTLLGDIHAESGELSQAAEWYEMALEIAPDSEPDRTKLAQVRERLSEKEMATTAKQLGLPPPKPRAKWFAWAAIAFVAIVGVGGFLLGDYYHAQQGPRVVRTPITVQGSAPQQPDEKTGEKLVPTPEERPTEPTTSPSRSQPRQDAEALSIIRNKCLDGERVSDAVCDLRTGAITVNYSLAGGESRRTVAARIAVSILDNFLEAPMVTVRGVLNGQVVYAADARRNDLLEVRRMQPPDGTDSSADLSAVLTNEWVAESPPTASEPGGSS